MTQATFGRMPSREIKKPKCTKCAAEMWLLHIEPQIAADLLTFECARCGAKQQQETSPGGSVAKTPARS